MKPLRIFFKISTRKYDRIAITANVEYNRIKQFSRFSWNGCAQHEKYCIVEMERYGFIAIKFNWKMVVEYGLLSYDESNKLHLSTPAENAT